MPPQVSGWVNTGMFSHGSRTGQVVRVDGSPAADLAVEYCRAGKGLADPDWRARSTRTNEKREFFFASKPPGDFLVGVNLGSVPKGEERILPAYWPDVSDLAEAGRIHLALNEQRKGLRIALGPRPGVRLVKVKVSWTDGRGVAELALL